MSKIVTLVPERVSVYVSEREKCAADSISRQDIFRLSSQTRRVPMAVQRFKNSCKNGTRFDNANFK